jgi:hypothetical protein
MGDPHIQQCPSSPASSKQLVKELLLVMTLSARPVMFINLLLAMMKLNSH